MPGRNALATLLALVMVTGVIGTYSLVGADDDRAELNRPPVQVAQARDDDRDKARERPERRERDDAQREREELERKRHERQAEMERRRREEEMARRREGKPHRPPEPMRPPFGREHVEQFGRLMQMVERMRNTCFSPEVAAMIAASGLKDDVPRKGEEVVEDLENTLKKTKSLGLRNAIRMMLRDIYRDLGKNDKVLQHLHEMLAENDEALHAEHQRATKGK